MENKVRLSKIKHVFISSLSVEYIGGLLGFLLTLSDMGKDTITLYGPSGLLSYYQILQKYMQYRIQFKIEIVEITQIENKIECKNFYIYSYLLKPFDTTGNNFFLFLVIYCIEPLLKPKFLPLKAKALGIPAGPLWAQLNQGNSIEFNGRIIYSEEVQEWSDESNLLIKIGNLTFIMFDCENRRVELDEMWKRINSKLKKKIDYIFHIMDERAKSPNEYFDIFTGINCRQVLLTKTNQLNTVQYSNHLYLIVFFLIFIEYFKQFYAIFHPFAFSFRYFSFHSYIHYSWSILIFNTLDSLVGIFPS